MTDPYIGRVKVGRITRDFREQPVTEKNDVLLPCPFCGSYELGLDCYSRDAAGVCLEPAVNCGGCGGIFIFDFKLKEPWADLAGSWNTRATPRPTASADVVERVAAIIEREFYTFVDDPPLPGAKPFEQIARAALTSLQTGEGWMRFLNAIMERTPNGEWIAVQYHPDGDWSVARQPLPPPPVEDDTP